MAARAVSASSTDPTPNRTSLPNSQVACRMTSNAPGVVIVTSIATTPPARTALAAERSWSGLLARMIATTPVSKILSMDPFALIKILLRTWQNYCLRLLEPRQNIPDKQVDAFSPGVVREPEHKVAEPQVGIAFDLLGNLIRRAHHRLIRRKQTGLLYRLRLRLRRRQRHTVTDVRFDEGVVVPPHCQAMPSQDTQPLPAEIQGGIIDVAPVGILGNDLQRALGSEAADQQRRHRIRPREAIGILDGIVFAVEARRILGPHLADDLDRFFELV